MTGVLCTKVAIPPQHVPSSSAADVRSIYSNSISPQVLSDGDRRPKHRSRKLFRFVAIPSTDHILKMESSKSIDCTILKSLKVPEPGLGVIFSVITPMSFRRRNVMR